MKVTSTQEDRDAVARIVAKSLEEFIKYVFTNYKLIHLLHPIEIRGVAVIPTGETCLVDVDLLDTVTQDQLAFSFEIPLEALNLVSGVMLMPEGKEEKAV